MITTEELTACRPAIILAGQEALDQEYRSAQWTYHRLLDFEDLHQQKLDEVQNQITPQLKRVGRILARLKKWNRWRGRLKKGKFVPRDRPELRAILLPLQKELREKRNADPRWKAILGWADEETEDATVKRPRRKKDESDEAFEERVKKNKKRSRRETYRVDHLFPQIRIFHETWNNLQKNCNQARQAVLKQRKNGFPAEWRRPRWNDRVTLCNAPHQYRIVEKNWTGPRGGEIWWTIEMRLYSPKKTKHKEKSWVRFKCKLANWHKIGDDCELGPIKLTREKNGLSWKYSVSLLVRGVEKKRKTAFVNGQGGMVALDWGHREYQHPTAREGIRAFYWRGDDGHEGEILLPHVCRKLKDRMNELQGRLDEMYEVRKSAKSLPERNRHRYRSRLMRSGVRTEEEELWLKWETRYIRRMLHCRKRIDNIREETYKKAVQELRQRYSIFVLEDESTRQHQQLDIEEMTRHRKRENRDMTARFEFTQICKRSGARILEVPSYNSTRECPQVGCGGLLKENGPELMVICPKCGTVRDKDQGATVVLLRRGKEALENQPATA